MVAEHGCEASLARPNFHVLAAGEHTDIPHLVPRLRHALTPAPPMNDQVVPREKPEEHRDDNAASSAQR